MAGKFPQTSKAALTFQLGYAAEMAAWTRVAGLVAVATGLAALAGGCAGDSSVRVRSEAAAVMDAPRLPLAVYSSPDQAAADIYLSDLSAADLDPGVDFTKVSGRIVAMRLFVVPLAGATPTDPSACSVSVRHIVLANGAIGVYSGGGFLNPSRAGTTDIAGTIRGATVRLTHQTAGFNDRLGPATLDAEFRAARDEAMARRLKVVVDQILIAAGKP
jgi:hypothetical protein